MARALKVFRTAAGFHDAFVAAPSRKAALAAWGADKDLFAKGLAEEVSDPALKGAALARPGEVIRVLRGTPEDQLAALGDLPASRKRPAASPASKPLRAPKPRPATPPDRESLDLAEKALDAARARHKGEMAAIESRIAALSKERDRLASDQSAEEERLAGRAERARASWDKAMEDWRRRES